MCKEFVLATKDSCVPFLVEETAYPGVKKVAEKVALDVKKVCDVEPIIVTNTKENAVIVGTLGKSDLLDQLMKQGKIDTTYMVGKREVYGIWLVDSPMEGMASALVIAGSDKLGTIYGLFSLSEYMGVSPMVEFGDAEPVRQEAVVINQDIEIISKEPSVKYRGFFINDEWPCFGNWTFSHFQGFTAKMYDHVFEFLLRMKGNYLWPAMWTSSFPLDGPGSLNEELADLYGVTVAYSHHEPCLRASEEWDLVRGENTSYGNEWNFYTNKEGLTNYWADGLKRSGKYQHMVTIGMRGERDSSMLGEGATLKDNIDLLKEIITTQRRLIGEHVNRDIDSVPQLLALYKEVEAYFYGDDETEGLKYWDELENVIFMLCEDNFGHMRTLPTKDIRNHKGGFGMYYHLDYHGGPVSYEWMPSTPLSLIWEQMTEAYDYGIKDVWVVNVGDLKGNEVALQYFLSMAYDFETWGSSAPNSWRAYMNGFAKKVFPQVDEKCQQEIADIYIDFVRLNAMRKPETVNSRIYNPCNYGEADRVLAMVDDLWQRNEDLYLRIPESAKMPYMSMFYHPAKSSLNLLRMHLYAGKNEHYAKQGRPIANLYGEKLAECIKLDRELSRAFGEFREGKWKGMELEEHVGFTKWNDDGWKYPVRMYVEPVTKARLSVSRWDEERIAVKNYGSPICIVIDEFCDLNFDEAIVEVSNDGVGSLNYRVTPVDGELPKWLKLSTMGGCVECLDTIKISVDRQELAKAGCSSCEGHSGECKAGNVFVAKFLVQDDETAVMIEVRAKNPETNSLPINTFLPSKDGVLVMEASHYAKKEAVGDGEFTLLEEYGREGNGMKILPSTLDFTLSENKPSVTYQFLVENAGNYEVEIWSAPVNSVQNRRPLNISVKASGQEEKCVEILSSKYRGGENSEGMWCAGVLDNLRKTKTTLPFEAGIQTLTIGGMEAGFVLERILIYPEGKKLKPSYLGPKESYMKK